MIPSIDNDLGISVYSTSFPGVGGTIRENFDDFQVFEILSSKSKAAITKDTGYPVYKLIKHQIDTTHALQIIFKKYGIQLKSFGLKDSLAITEQYVLSMNKSKFVENLSEKKFTLQKIGFIKKPLTKKNIVGNHFKIRISNPVGKISDFKEYEHILNFFGYQRFGSKRPVTHLIGKALLKKDFDKAIKLLLCYSSKYDSPNNSDLRKLFSNSAKYSQLLQQIPKQMDLERIVIKEIIEHDDSFKAIKALPIFIRRLYVQAYQSFIFNKTLSIAFDEGEDLFLPKEGDVCFDEHATIGKFSGNSKQKLAIPTLGYAYYKKTRFHYYISKILESEEITPKEFFLKDMQEISNEGGFRMASMTCTDYSSINDIVEFSLSRGSFATILLREIMKPKDPIIAGF